MKQLFNCYVRIYRRHRLAILLVVWYRVSLSLNQNEHMVVTPIFLCVWSLVTMRLILWYWIWYINILNTKMLHDQGSPIGPQARLLHQGRVWLNSHHHLLLNMQKKISMDWCPREVAFQVHWYACLTPLVSVLCHYTLPLYTATTHCHYTLPLHTATTHCHYTLPLYTATAADFSQQYWWV